MSITTGNRVAHSNALAITTVACLISGILCTGAFSIEANDSFNGLITYILPGLFFGMAFAISLYGFRKARIKRITALITQLNGFLIKL